MHEINLRKVDLNLLAIFKTVYEERQLARAGHRLGLTQPAVSHALGRLRTLFDDALFVRTRQGMEPTTRAREIAQSVFEALALVERVVAGEQEFDPRRARRRFRIRMSDYGSALLGPGLLARLGERAPMVRLQVVHTTMADALSQLEAGSLDLAVGTVAERARRYVAEELWAESYTAIASRANPATQRRIRLKTFVEMRHVEVSANLHQQRALRDVLESRGLALNVVASVPHFTAVPAIVARSPALVSIVPRRLVSLAPAGADLAHLDVPLRLPGFNVVALRHRRAEKDTALLWLSQLLREVAREPDPGGTTA